MGDSVTSIGNDAFRNCVSLETIRIPASVETIGSSAFANCTSLKEVSYLNAETIGDSAFYNCTSLETVWMVHNVKTVSNYAFRYCPEDSMTVHFYGTEEDWSEISIGSYNDPLLNANIIFEDVIKTLAITPDTYLLPLGETAEIILTVTPEDADTSALKWSSSDEEVVTVDEEGNVTGITEGTSVIKVEAELPYETLRAVCTVTVHRVYAEGITIAEGEDTVAVGGTIRLEVVFDPANTTNKNVTWTSSDESIAKVDENGTVTGVSAGDAVITVTSEDGGYTAEREVHVIVPAEGISVNEEESVSEIEYGHTGSIKIIFSPSDTTNQNVTWTSSDETIATVDENGVITAIGEGPVTITATSEDGGFTASKEINIIYRHIERIELEEDIIEALPGYTQALHTVFTPEDASNKKVIYASDNEEAVTVDNEGKITCITYGTAVITVTTEDGEKTAECTVTVKRETTVVLNMKEASVPAGSTVQLEAEAEPEGTKVYWTSKDPSIATVDERGLVRAVSIGKTEIEATAEDGTKDTCEIMVQFKDVTDSDLFYYDYVYDMVEKGVVGGYVDGTFKPGNDCNRAAVVTFLWRLEGRPEPTKMATFKDMTNNSDFDKAISWAAEKGITTGWDDNTFRPWNTCNRAAVLTFLWRTAGRPEPSRMATFSDMTGNSDFDKAISWGVEKGITTGWEEDNTFRPWRTCNRLAVVSFLARYDGLSKPILN